jgi:hypothetical protein
MVKAAYRHQILSKRAGADHAVQWAGVFVHASGIAASGFKSMDERNYSPSPSGRRQGEGVARGSY